MEMQDTARRRATRARLVEAALSEFGRNGIDATSVEQLCEAADFTRGAFYSNFTSKDDLCIEVARHLAEETAARFRDVIAGMPDEITHDDIVAAILDIAHLAPDAHATMVEMSLRAARDPEFGARFRATREDLWPLYIDLLEQAAVRGTARYIVPTSDVLQISEALLYSPNLIGYQEEARRLITMVTQHLIEPVDGGAAQ